MILQTQLHIMQQIAHAQGGGNKADKAYWKKQLLLVEENLLRTSPYH